MKGQPETIKLAVEILTPVHVGSGEELHRELDYVEQRGQVFVVDQNQTFDAIASGNAELDTLLQANSKLNDVVKLAEAYHGYLLPSLSNAPVPERIRACMKDAMFHPYLPGSSIKGAIRTALLAEWLRSIPDEAIKRRLPQWRPEKHKPTQPPKKAAVNVTQYVFGENPNKDLLRALHVGDANFQTGDLRLADVRWLNVTKTNDKESAKWRNMSNRRNENSWQDASGIYAEALAPHAIAAMALQWDRFLLSDLMRWKAPQHGLKLLPTDFTGLLTKLNTHAASILRQEIEFFQRYRQETIVQRCNTLLQSVQQADNVAYLRLAWGSGWRGMTGDWQDAKNLEKMRKLYNLGKPESETFPKTRRLAVQGDPCLPLGWIKLSPWSVEVEKRIESQKTNPTHTQISPWVEEQLAIIQERLHASADDALRGQPLAKSWQAIEDRDLKQKAFADIRARWQKRGWWDNPPSKSTKKVLAIYKGEN